MGVVMSFEVMLRFVSILSRFSKLAVCVALAVALVWRGQTFAGFGNDPFLAPLMCILTATVLVFTGLGLTFAVDEAERQN